jgi:3-hydroxyisobutyrate dehydrogenase-like beta-hydroxyacid dehydrogenase
MKTTVGFLGLGAMGAPMASNLIGAGFTVRAWNRSAAKVAALTGAVACRSPREAAEGSAFVITMLADDASVEAVTVGADGILAGLAPNATHIGMSTISVAATKKFAEMHVRAGCNFVAAPVFGRPEAARAHMLWIVPGGEARLIERADPLFKAMGQGTFPQATAEQAALAKLAGNFLIGATIEMIGEALALAEKGGLDPEALMGMLGGTLFGSPVFKNYGARIARTEFVPPGFTVALARKDFRLIQEAAADGKVPMPLADLVATRLSDAVRLGRGEYDFAGMATVIRESAGLGERRGDKLSP